MGKHEASPGKKTPAGNGKKKHTVLWILLAVVLVLGCAAAWILLRTPDQNRVIGTKDPNQTQQQEQPNQPGRTGSTCFFVGSSWLDSGTTDSGFT